MILDWQADGWDIHDNYFQVYSLLDTCNNYEQIFYLFILYLFNTYISAAYSSLHQGKMVVTKARAIILLKLSNITIASTDKPKNLHHALNHAHNNKISPL